MLLAVNPPGLALLYQLSDLRFPVLHLDIDRFLRVLAAKLVVVFDLDHGPFSVASRNFNVCFVLCVGDFRLPVLGGLQLFQQGDVFWVLSILRQLQFPAHFVYLSSKFFLVCLQLLLCQVLRLHII